MVFDASSEAGRAGDLGGLEGLPDMSRLGVVGDGRMVLDPSSRPWRLTWSPQGPGTIAPQSAQSEHGVSWLVMRLFSGASAERDAIDSALDAYSARIAYLRDEATHDGYGLNERSEGDFKQFVRSRPHMRKGNLVLLDNGNLRAIWKDEQGGRLGLQFLGGNMVQYVIFWRRQADQAISRVAGRDSLEGIVQQIDAFQLHSLLSE
jgi:hypothetical protein